MRTEALCQVLVERFGSLYAGDLFNVLVGLVASLVLVLWACFH